MAVSIIGAGAIGLLFAAYLKKADVDVTVYTRTDEQAEIIRREGLYLIVDDEKTNVEVRAKSLASDETIEDEMIIVCVKQYQMNDLKQILRKNSKGKIFLFLQNGLSHLSFLKELNDCQILLGVVEHGAKKIAQNRVIHTGIGQTNIAYFSSVQMKAEPAFFRNWNQVQFPFVFRSDWYEMAAYKLIANAVINPLTAIFRVKNGQLLTNPYLRTLMRLLWLETVQVLRLPSEQLWDYVVDICEKTRANESSMLRDIEAKRLTEIDAISGYIIEQAKMQNINVPYTTFVYNSIKALERKNELSDKKEGRQNDH